MPTTRARRPHDERGEIGLVAAIVALLIGAALGGVTIAATSPGRSAPPGVFIRINSAKVARTDSGGLQVDVKYTVAVEPDAAGNPPWTEASRIYCIATEQPDGTRWGSGQASVFILPSTSRDDSITLAIDTVHSTGGTVVINCDISREGRSFQSGPVELTIPGPSQPVGTGGGPNTAFSAANYVGTYQTTFTTIVGIVLNCGPSTVGTTIDVSEVNPARIKLGLSSAAVPGASTSFEANLAPTAQFSGELPSFGFMTGRFENRSGKLWLTGKAESPDGHCTWSIEGPRQP